MQKSDQSTIFNIFHDGTFLSFQREADDIDFRIEIQYLAAMIDPTYTYFTGVFKNCQQFLLQLWEDEKKYYEDIDLISTLSTHYSRLPARLHHMHAQHNLPHSKKPFSIVKDGCFLLVRITSLVVSLFGCIYIHKKDNIGYAMRNKNRSKVIYDL